MNDEQGWALLRRYGSRLEAELDQGILETAGIPVLVKGPITGIFGPGFAGMTSQGAAIHVPRADLEHARELVGLDEEEGE